MSKALFDKRWLTAGGIGRFCSEISKSASIKQGRFLEGNIRQALSPKDMFFLSKIAVLGDIFISPGYNCPLFSCGRAIVTLHDLMHLNFPEYSNLKNTLYYRYVVRRAVQSAPLVFTVSEFTRKEIAGWANIPLDKISVVPNGVDHDRYHADVKPLERSRPYFFYVGNNKSHKNLERLIRAFSNSKLDQHVDLLLSCPPTSELEKLVDKLDLSKSIFFLSGIKESELPSYYKGALATLMVTLYEGFGLPILESMAVGTPVISSNITAMPEVAGGAALLADPYSIESIGDAMLKILNDESLRVELSQKGLIRAQEFSWDKSRELWDMALQPILEKL